MDDTSIMQRKEQEANARPEPIRVVTVDDEPQIISQIMRLFGPSGSLSFQHFLRLDDLLSADLRRVDLCIADLFFGETFLGGRLVQSLKVRWPAAQIIILSNFVEMLGPHVTEMVFSCIAKPEFALQPSVLRSAVIGAIRSSKMINADSASLAIDSIIRTESGDFAQNDEIDLILHGRICYPFRSPRKIIYGEGRFGIEGVPEIIGEGETYADAKVSFIRRFHEQFVRFQVAEFQEPARLPAPLWLEMRELVDEKEYERLRTTVVPREVGQLVAIDNNGRRRIQWSCGPHKGEVVEVEVEEWPNDLVTMEVGRYFGGSVVRRFASGEFLRLLHGEPILTPASALHSEGEDKT